MGNIRLDDWGPTMEDIHIGTVVYAMDNFQGSNKVRPWIVRSIDDENQTMIVNPITSQNNEFVIDIIEIRGQKSYVNGTRVELHIDDIDSIEPTMTW